MAKCEDGKFKNTCSQGTRILTSVQLPNNMRNTSALCNFNKHAHAERRMVITRMLKNVNITLPEDCHK